MAIFFGIENGLLAVRADFSWIYIEQYGGFVLGHTAVLFLKYHPSHSQELLKHHSLCRHIIYSTETTEAEHKFHFELTKDIPYNGTALY